MARIELATYGMKGLKHNNNHNGMCKAIVQMHHRKLSHIRFLDKSFSVNKSRVCL